MGVRVSLIYALVLAISGGLAAVSGIMVSSLASLLPNMGGDPMLKAFIICVVAGLGNVYGRRGRGDRARPARSGGAVSSSAFSFRFAILLLLVIVVLIWRPYGLFGRQQVVRL